MNSTTSRDVLIQTERLDEAATFYEEILGLQPFLREPTIIGLETGAFRLFLDRGPAYGPVFEVFVDNLEDAKTRLVAAGCVIEHDDPTIPRCYIRDPFGLVFNIAVGRSNKQ